MAAADLFAMCTLFAITQVSFWLGAVGLATCLLMIGFGILAPRPQSTASVAKPRLSTLLIGFVVFHAIWIWLSATLPLLAWLFWLGDADDHWFYRSSGLIAAAVSLGFVAWMIGRVWARTTTKRYVRLLLWSAASLLVLYAMICAYEFCEDIDGMTAQAAAENVLRRMYPPAENPGMYLLEQESGAADSAEKARFVTYLIRDETEPRGRITVCRYGWFWWRFAGSARYPPSTQELDLAKHRLEEPGGRDVGLTILERIMTMYPGTETAAEANELLEQLKAKKGDSARPAQPLP